jgi:hypothetical protein
MKSGVRNARSALHPYGREGNKDQDHLWALVQVEGADHVPSPLFDLDPDFSLV